MRLLARMNEGKRDAFGRYLSLIAVVLDNASPRKGVGVHELCACTFACFEPLESLTDNLPQIYHAVSKPLHGASDPEFLQIASPGIHQ